MSLIPVLGGVASAQPMGIFRWQQQPSCNVLTVSVVQAGSVFHLDGVDDQCGAGTAASVVGLAFGTRRARSGSGSRWSRRRAAPR